MKKSYINFVILVLMAACNKNSVAPSVDSSSYSSINGRVVDKYSFPIRAISRSKVFISSPFFTDSVTTDSSGQFQFLHLSTGHHSIIATAAHYDTLTTDVVLQKDQPLAMNIEITLNNPYKLGSFFAGFQDSTTVEAVFQLYSGLSLTIKTLEGFNLQSNLTVDSLSFVRLTLESKPYLTETDYTIYVKNGVIWILGGFTNLDSLRMTDWSETQKQLKIVSAPSPYAYAQIETEEGQETKWVRELRNYSIIKWLDLDYYIIFGP